MTVVVLLKVPLVPLMVSALVPLGVLLLVVMVRVEVQDGPLADVGLKVAVERDGNPVTLKLTLLEKPLIGVIVTRKLTLEPRLTVWGDGAEMLKPLTFWLTTFEVLELSLLSPLYLAVIGCVPTERLVVDNFAVPLLSVALPIDIPLS